MSCRIEVVRISTVVSFWFRMFWLTSWRTRQAVKRTASISVPATMRMTLVRIERSETGGRRRTSGRRAVGAIEAQAAVELERLPVLVDPDRDRVEAARGIPAPRLEHRLDRRILVDADAGRSRLGREGADQLR